MKWLNRTLLHIPFRLGICTSEKKFKREMKRLGVKPCPQFLSDGADATTTYIRRKGKLSAIIGIGPRKGYSHIEVDGLVLHECMHIWQEAKRRMRETAPGDEIEAYVVQWLYQVVRKGMK